MEPVADLRDVVGVEARIARPGVGHNEERNLAHIDGVEPLREVRSDLRQGLEGNPVEHYGGAHAALVRIHEGLPREGVSVPRGGCDKEPEVGGVEQSPRNFAVVRVDGVQVGGVDEYEPGNRLVGDDDAAHLGDRVILHDLRVLRMDRYDRRARRRADDRRRRDVLPQQRVEYRRLPSAGGSAENRHGGKPVGSQVRKDPRSQLCAQPFARVVQLHRSGKIERQTRVVQRRDRASDEAGKVASVVRCLHSFIIGHH